MSTNFKDFDAAVSEVEDRWTEFKIGGESFKVNLNVPAGKILQWMENGSKVEGVPLILKAFLEDADYRRLISLDVPWGRMEELVQWLAGELGGQGN